MPDWPMDIPLPPRGQLELWTDPRLWVGIIGVIMLVRGAQWYRLVIITPGLAIGAWLGVKLTAGSGDQMQILACVALALIGAIGLHLVERLAIAVTGALVLGSLTETFAPTVLGTAAPWYIPAAGALVGLLVFPRIYSSLLPFITSGLGAMCLAWSMGKPRDLLLLGAFTAMGLVAQSLFKSPRWQPQRRGENE